MATLVQVEKYGPTAKLVNLTSDTFTLSNAATLNSSFSTLNYQLSATPSGRPEYGMVADELSGTTTITIRRDASQASSITALGYVAEFSSGVTVERGTTSLTGSAAVDATLSTITDISKAFVIARLSVDGTVYGGQHGLNAYLWNDSGTLKLRCEVNAAVTSTVYWQVVQMDNITVQRGSNTTMSATDVSETQAISTVDRTKSFLLFYYKHANPGSAVDIGAVMLDGYLSSDTQITFERDHHGSTAIADIRWEVVSFTSGANVREVRHTFAATENTANKTILDVTAATNALAIGSNRTNFGSTAANTDTIGEACFTYDITTTTNVTVARNSGQDAFEGRTTLYVIDLGVVTPPAGTAQRVINANAIFGKVIGGSIV